MASVHRTVSALSATPRRPIRPKVDMAPATVQSKAPPLQLIAGDRYNLTLGISAAFALACTKDQPNLPPFLRWQLNAYTNWNLSFIAIAG